MAGRKQHYIPQFLLRAFAEAGSGKHRQVRVVTPDRTFLTSTEGVAAEREFYSKLDEGPEALDHVITSAEAEYATMHRQLAALPAGAVVSHEAVGRLLTHLTVRTGHSRDTLSVAGQYAAKRARDVVKNPDFIKAQLGISKGEPSAYMRAELDKMYNTNRARVAKAGMSRHEFRRFAFNILIERWQEWLTSSHDEIEALVLMLDFGDIAADGHRKALSKSYEPTERVEALASLDWEVYRGDSAIFALPDAIAVAHHRELGVAPLGFVGNDDLVGAVFPLSSKMCLCGGIYRPDQLLSTLLVDFPAYAALSSWNFLVLPPSLTHYNCLGARIGGAVSRVIVATIEEAISEKMAEALLS